LAQAAQAECLQVQMPQMAEIQFLTLSHQQVAVLVVHRLVRPATQAVRAAVDLLTELHREQAQLVRLIKAAQVDRAVRLVQTLVQVAAVALTQLVQLVLTQSQAPAVQV
jgi:arginine utilization protein RocB